MLCHCRYFVAEFGIDKLNRKERRNQQKSDLKSLKINAKRLQLAMNHPKEIDGKEMMWFFSNSSNTKYSPFSLSGFFFKKKKIEVWVCYNRKNLQHLNCTCVNNHIVSYR